MGLSDPIYLLSSAHQLNGQPRQRDKACSRLVRKVHLMSRYFFHIMNGHAILDDVGVELPDMDAVRFEAIRSSGAMLSDGKQTWKGECWQMVVVDEAGTVVFGTKFSTDRHGL